MPKHAVLAVQNLFHCNEKFTRAWTCLWAWRHKLPVRHRTPLPFEVLCGLFDAGLDGWLRDTQDGLMLPSQ